LEELQRIGMAAQEKDLLGMDPALAVRLADGLLEYGLPREKVSGALVYEFGMIEPPSDVEFWKLVSEARQRMQEAGEADQGPSDSALRLVLANIMRRQGVRRLRHHDSQREWKPGDPPDYSRLRRYEASPAELEIAGTPSVDALVQKVNRLSKLGGRSPVTQGDFPSSKRKFHRLVARLAELEQLYGHLNDDACSPEE
jgi:hypothetical protein